MEGGGSKEGENHWSKESGGASKYLDSTGNWIQRLLSYKGWEMTLSNHYFARINEEREEGGIRKREDE